MSQDFSHVLLSQQEMINTNLKTTLVNFLTHYTWPKRKPDVDIKLTDSFTITGYLEEINGTQYTILQNKNSNQQLFATTHVPKLFVPSKLADNNQFIVTNIYPHLVELPQHQWSKSLWTQYHILRRICNLQPDQYHFMVASFSFAGRITCISDSSSINVSILTSQLMFLLPKNIEEEDDTKPKIALEDTFAKGIKSFSERMKKGIEAERTKPKPTEIL